MELSKLGTEYSVEHLGFQKIKTDILIGSKLDRFVPNINFGKWSDECWLNINYPVPITTEKEVYSVDAVQIQTKDNEIHKFYMTPEGELEYEIILPVKPLKSEWVFNLAFPDGLNFYYQPPLTDEIDGIRIVTATEIGGFDKDGNQTVYRPENVIGSYAVYWNRKNNQYQTGKFCHIMRPLVTDAVGKKIWGRLYVDSIQKTMSISVDPIWLDKATYPVLIDPTIGYNTIGGTQDSTGAYILACRFNCPTTGSANPGTFYLYGRDTNGPRNWPGAVYEIGDGNISGNAKLSTSDAIISMQTTNGWRSANITYTGFTAGTDYFLAVAGQQIGVCYTYYDTVTAGYEDMQYDAGTTLPNPFGTRDGTIVAEGSWYIDYAAAGGGGDGTDMSWPIINQPYPSKNEVIGY